MNSGKSSLLPLWGVAVRSNRLLVCSNPPICRVQLLGQSQHGHELRQATVTQTPAHPPCGATTGQLGR